MNLTKKLKASMITKTTLFFTLFVSCSVFILTGAPAYAVTPISDDSLSGQSITFDGGEYKLTGDLHGKSFEITGDTTIDLCGHVIDGDKQQDVGFDVDEGKTLTLLNSGNNDGYIRNYDEHAVLLDDGSKLNMPQRRDSGNVILSGCGEGAIYVDGDNVNIDGGIVSGNHMEGSYFSSAKGAGIYVDGDKCCMRNITVRGNYAHKTSIPVFAGGSSYGGGIYIDGDQCAIDHFLIKDNHATDGGGVYSNGAETSFSDGDFVENTAYVSDADGSGEADGEDGGAANMNAKWGFFHEVDFTDNAAGEDGGAVYNDGRYVKFIECDLSGNKAMKNGGAVCDEFGQAKFEHCTITANHARNGDGGGVYGDGGSDLDGCRVEENLAGGNGGGIYGSNGLSLTHSTIRYNDCGSHNLGAGVWSGNMASLYGNINIYANGGIKDDGSPAGGKTFSNLYLGTASYDDRMAYPIDLWIDTPATRRDDFVENAYSGSDLGVYLALDRNVSGRWILLQGVHCDRTDMEFFQDSGVNIRSKGRDAYLEELKAAYSMNEKARTNLKDGEVYTSRVYPKVSTPMELRTIHQLNLFNPTLQYRSVTEENGEKVYGEWKSLETGIHSSGSNDEFKGIYKQSLTGLGKNGEKVTYQVKACCWQRYEMPEDGEGLQELYMETPENIKEITVDLRDGITKKAVIARTITKAGDEETEKPAVYKNVLLADAVDREGSYEFTFRREYAPKGYRIKGVKVYYDDAPAPDDALVSYNKESMTGSVKMPDDMNTTAVYLVPEIERIEYHITLKYSPEDLQGTGMISEAEINAFLSQTFYYGQRFALPNILSPYNGGTGEGEESGIWKIDNVEVKVLVPEKEEETSEQRLERMIQAWINGTLDQEMTDSGESEESHSKTLTWKQGKANYYTITEPYENNIELSYNLERDENQVRISFYNGYGLYNTTWDKGTTLRKHKEEFDSVYRVVNYFVRCHKDEAGNWTYDENKDIVDLDQPLKNNMVLYPVMMRASCVIPCDENGRSDDNSNGSTLVFRKGSDKGSLRASFIEGEPVEVRYTGDKVVKEWYVLHAVHGAGVGWTNSFQKEGDWINSESSRFAGINCSCENNSIRFQLSKDIITPDKYNNVSTVLLKPILADPVTNITGVPDTMGVGEIWNPAGAAVWPESVKDSQVEWTATGPEGREEIGENFMPEHAGSYTLKATVKNGLGLGTDYTQDFTINVTGQPEYEVAFTSGAKGVEAPEPQLIGEGSVAGQPVNPVREGYVFGGWYVTTENAEDQPYDFATPVTDNLILKAHWLCQVRASVDGGGGSVAVTGTAAGDDLYPEGSSVTIAATPDSGKRVAGWTDNGEPVAGNETAVYTIEDLNAAHEVKVSFKADQEPAAEKHTVFTKQKGQSYGLWSDVTLSGEGSYAPGEAVTLTAIPDEGYSVYGWTNDYSRWMSHTNTYTFTMGEDDVWYYPIVYPTVRDISMGAADQISVGDTFRPGDYSVIYDKSGLKDNNSDQFFYSCLLSCPQGSDVVNGSGGVREITPKQPGNIVIQVVMETASEGTPAVTRFVKNFTIKVNPAPHTVTFKNGEETIATKTVNHGNPVDSIGGITSAGKQFEGWMLNGSKYDFTQPVTENLTLTAGWIAATHVDATVTCTKAGMIEHYMIGTGDEAKYYTDAYLQNEVTADKLQRPAGGHSVNNGESASGVEYVWSEDKRSVTARGTCTICGTELEKTVQTESSVAREATCTEPGQTRYTAAFDGEYACFQPVTETVENVPAQGHSWGETEYEWSDDNTRVTATRTCQREGCGLKETETATTNIVTRSATCTQAGETKYTASFENSAFTEQSKNVGEPKALGHSMTEHAANEATCTEDGNSAYFSCGRCEKFFSDEAGQNMIAENSWVIAKSGHRWNGGNVTKNPTCTEKGEKTFECTVCHETKKEDVAAVGHNMTAHAANAATCTAEGNSAYWSCNRCEKYFSDEAGTTEIAKDSWVIKKADHSWSDWVERIDDSGHYYGRSCSSCNAVERLDIAPQDCEHKYEKIPSVAPTCTVDGYGEYFKCEKCKTYFVYTNNVYESINGNNAEAFINELTIPATGHKWNFTGFTWEGTGSDGYTQVTANYVCENNADHKDSVQATLTSEVEIPTCTKGGKTTYTATISSDGSLDGTARSDSMTAKIINAPGHNLTKHDAKVSCTEAGNSEYWSCDGCGKFFSDEAGENEIEKNSWVIAKSGHSWNEGTITKDPTCTEKGEKTFKCTACHETKTEDIAALGHQMKANTEKGATCTEEGLKAHFECTGCHKLFVKVNGEYVEKQTEDLSIPASHDYKATVSKEPTCTVPGERVFECTDCHDKKTEDIAALGHNYGEWTYLDADQHQKVCANDSTHVEKENHKWDNGQVTKEPTATENGVRIYTCETCQGTRTEIIPSGGGGGGGETVVTDDVQTVIDMINNLPDKVTIENAAAIIAAREAYESLSDEQKKDPKLTEAFLKKLTDAEEALRGAQDQEAADEVIKYIAALPEKPEDSTREQIAEIRDAYEALSDSARELIEHGELLKLEKAEYFWAKNDAEAQKTKMSSAKARKGKKAVVKWKENPEADGYLLYYKAKGVKAKTVSINSAKTLTKTVKKLRAGKKYTFKVRTFNKVYNPSTGKNEKAYGKWSIVKRVKARK